MVQSDSARTSIEDLCFYDLRSAVISRLFGEGPCPFMQVSGHTTPSMLMGDTHLHAAAKLGA